MKKETLHIYTRVSTLHQEEEGTSLGSQRSAGERKAKGLKMIPKLWNEGGKSSNHEDFTNRPVLQMLLTEIEEGKVKNLFVYNTDRLSRNPQTWSVIRWKLKEHQVKLLTGSGEMDLSDPMDNLLFGVLTEISQYDNVIRTSRVRMGKLQRVKKGYWYGGPPPFGYEVVNKKLSTKVSESKWVKKIYDWYLHDVPVKEIRLRLMKNGVTTRRGNTHWSLGSIRKILKNTHYLGYFIYTDKEYEQTVKGNCPIILNQVVWDKCQQKNLKRLERRGQTNRTKRFYLLTKFLYCEHCGKPMGGRWNEHNNTKVYYCVKNERSWVTEDKPIKCMNRGLNIPRTDALVWNAILDVVRDSHFLKEQTKTLVMKQVYDDRANYIENNKREKKRFRELIKDVQRIDNTLAELETQILLKQTDNLNLTRKIIKNIRKERARVSIELNESRTRISTISHQLEWVDWVAKFNSKIDKVEKYKKPEQQRIYLEGLIQRIDVSYDHKTKEHTLKIKFNYPIVGDELKYKNKRKKSGAYKIVNGSDTHEIEYSKKSSTTVGDHSTVTDLARFRGLSTSLPRSTAA